MQKIDTNPKKIKELLSRSVEEVISRKSLEEKLLSGKRLNIKLGIDPTSPNLHLGRAVVLWKLKDFQDLGHKIILILGDFTGVVGDTSDKESERPMLDPKIVRENMKTYKKQAGKILDLSKVEVVKNSKWLSKLGYAEIGRHADAFSVSDFISRELIRKRLKAGNRISLRELLYPLMQGYDSIALQADVEIGGTDQKFNLLAGRTLQKEYDQKPQDILILGPLLEGTDGRKMSSSWGNTVNLLDSPEEMFGKIMRVGDKLIRQYFVHTTRIEAGKIDSIMKNSPREAKLALAEEVCRIYHGEKKATSVRDDWIRQFSKKETPKNLKEVVLPADFEILPALEKIDLIKSRAEGRRKIDERALSIDGKKIQNIKFKFKKKGNYIIKFGRKIIRVKVK